MPPGISDLTDGSASAPSGIPNRKKGSRRETILSLVEMLLQNGTGTLDLDDQRQFEDDGDVPTVDDHIQTAGAEAFQRFQKRIMSLDQELRNFANAARQLGSSAAILASAFQLRTRIAHVLHLYRENAEDLFPKKLKRSEVQPANDPTVKVRKKILRRLPKLKAHVHVARPTVDESMDAEDFPQQFCEMARDVKTFMHSLNEFPEFMDEAFNASIIAFEGDLKYWSSCLLEYKGQFKYPSVQRYLHDLSTEMGDHLDTITANLTIFIEVGVPTIRFAQKHGANNLLNLSTVATFFSAVTATTLQFSYEDNKSPAGAVVNTFWFGSLVFSIAAAVNSLLGLTWKQAMYRSPGNRVPWWVLIWIKRSPLVFLVLSVACFSVGLCAFTYSSFQATVTQDVTTVLTALTSFGLAAVSAWFASERWIYSRHSGRKWLSDIIQEQRKAFVGTNAVRSTSAFVSATGRAIKDVSRQARVVPARALSRLSTANSNAGDSNEKREDDLEANTNDNIALSPTHERDVSFRQGRMSESTAGPGSPDVEGYPATPANSPPGSPISPASTQTEGRQLWRNAIKTVKMRSAVSANLTALSTQPRSPHRQRTISSGVSVGKDGLKSLSKSIADSETLGMVVQRSRVTALQPKLKVMERTQDLAAHQALVRHLQFSPDGKFLASSSWDRTSVIFRVGDPFVSHRMMAHTGGFVGQVAWSPSGEYLLTKSVRGITIWTVGGVCERKIRRDTQVESITWFPNGDAFLSVEGNTAVKMDMKGKVTGTYDFGKIKLHDVAVTHDSVRLLGVGPLLQSPDGLVPSKSRGEKRLIVYNMDTGQMENQTPVLNDVRDITLSNHPKHGTVALISYENKAPPQLWKMEFVKDRDDPAIQTARLTLRHTYMPKLVVDFAGPSYFGGKNNELVLCAGKAGDIHIWDRESAALLQYIRPVQGAGDLTCIAWNHMADDPFMFATGSHDGAIHVWTKPTEQSDIDYDNPPLRTASPFGMERTDSPTTQFEDSTTSLVSNNARSSSEAGPSRERLIAFADENTNTNNGILR